MMSRFNRIDCRPRAAGYDRYFRFTSSTMMNLV